MQCAVGGDRPPIYTLFDTSDPSGAFATQMGDDIIANCRRPSGAVDNQQLRQIMDMVVTYVNNQTGVLPSVCAGSSQVNNNPTDPDEWNWDSWYALLVPSRCAGDLNFSRQRKVFSILGAGIGKDESKILALLAHSEFTRTVLTPLEDHAVKNLIQSAGSGQNFIEQIVRHYSMRSTDFLCGMIRAAIALGYLPRKDIQALYDMARNC